MTQAALDPPFAPAADPPVQPPRPLPVSPELALVDEELRELAISLLPPVRPFAFLERPLRELDGFDDDEPHWLRVATVELRPDRGIAVAATAYLVGAVLRTIAFNVIVFVGVAVLVLLLNVA